MLFINTITNWFKSLFISNNSTFMLDIIYRDQIKTLPTYNHNYIKFN